MQLFKEKNAKIIDPNCKLSNIKWKHSLFKNTNDSYQCDEKGIVTLGKTNERN